MPLDGSSGPTLNESRVTAEERATYPNAYFSIQGPGFPSVLLLAEFNSETGAIAEKEGQVADLLIKKI